MGAGFLASLPPAILYCGGAGLELEEEADRRVDVARRWPWGMRSAFILRTALATARSHRVTLKATRPKVQEKRATLMQMARTGTTKKRAMPVQKMERRMEKMEAQTRTMKMKAMKKASGIAAKTAWVTMKLWGAGGGGHVSRGL